MHALRAPFIATVTVLGAAGCQHARVLEHAGSECEVRSAYRCKPLSTCNPPRPVPCVCTSADASEPDLTDEAAVSVPALVDPGRCALRVAYKCASDPGASCAAPPWQDLECVAPEAAPEPAPPSPASRLRYVLPFALRVNHHLCANYPGFFCSDASCTLPDSTLAECQPGEPLLPSCSEY